MVGGSGYRRLLRFDTVLMNRGDGDLVVGDRSDPNNPYAPYFVFHPCHGHYHIKTSRLRAGQADGDGRRRRHEAGILLRGFVQVPRTAGRGHGYDCHDQGITSGWGDWYYKQLVGQWIDITGVPEGEYIVRVTLNQAPIFNEGENRYPNVTQIRVYVPNPRKKVTVVE